MKNILFVLMLSGVALMAQSRPLSDVNIRYGGFTRYDSNGVPFVSGTFTGTATTSTNINISTVGDTAVTSEAGIPVAIISGAGSVSFPEGSTNATGAFNLAPTNVIGVASLELTNSVALLNAISNLVSVLTSTNSLIGDSLSNLLAGTLTVTPTVTGGEMTSETMTNLLLQIIATNSAALNAVSNEVYLLKEQIAGGIGFTNGYAAMTNAPTDLLYVISSGTNAITFDDGVTLPAFAAVPTVSPTESTNKTYGWPLYSVAAHYSVAEGVTTNGAAIVAAQEVIADDDTDIPYLLSATYILNTNCYSYAPQIIAYVFKAEPTTVGAYGALQFTYADWTNCVGTLAFTNRWFNAGTNAVQTITAGFNVAPTNWIVPVVETLAYTNLAGSDTIVFSFQQGK